MECLEQKIILSIDDDRFILESISCVLESEGYKVLTAGNGYEALKLLDSLADHELPHLIMLDYQMPVLNGLQFNLARLKIPRLAKIPVVVMTASGNLLSIMQTISAEAYISKPMDIDHILKVAHNFVNRRETASTSFLT